MKENDEVPNSGAAVVCGTLEPILNRFRLDDQIAIVTGAGGGIGEAVSSAFARVGATVILADLNESVAQVGATQINERGGTASAQAIDVSNPESVSETIDAVKNMHGRIDILVNCAGISLRRPAIDTTPAEWQRVLQVNLTGTFLCAQCAGRHMMQQPEGGRIINVASVGAFYGGGLYANSAYKASKGGVLNMTRALAVEWAPYRIRVNGVAPSFIRTQMANVFFQDAEKSERARAITPLSRLGELDDLIGAFLYLASRASDWVTGQTIIVDGGLLSR
jgi:NAD(P)-dependent dehydrogenase (short-subunit alcohol dehydrogenase family)